MNTSFLCRLFGHKYRNAAPVPVGGLGPEDQWTKFPDGSSMFVLYYAHPCLRSGCYHLKPAAGDEGKKSANDAEINQVMNASRAQYGLKPLDFSRAIILACVLSTPTFAQSSTPRLESINWMNDPIPCTGEWGWPLRRAYDDTNNLCLVGQYRVTICPQLQLNSAGPYNNGAVIQVLSWQVTHILSDPTAGGWWELGSAWTSGGADAFASGGGTGTYSRNDTIRGAALWQGGPWPTDQSHIDLYAGCTRGTQRLHVVIGYRTYDPQIKGYVQ